MDYHFNMKTKTTISITGDGIVKNYLCEALNITSSEYDIRFKKAPPKVYWNIKETGDHDKGTYERVLTEVEITI